MEKDYIYVFAAKNNIYYLSEGDKGLFAGRYHIVTDLAFHNGRLYDCGLYKEVYDSLAEEKIAERQAGVLSLESHEGRLFDCGRYGVCETHSGRQISKIPLRHLVSHGGKLLGADLCNIYDVLTGKRLKRTKETIADLLSHPNGNLYFAGKNHIFDIFSDEVIKPQKFGRIKALTLHTEQGEEVIAAVMHYSRHSTTPWDYLCRVYFKPILGDPTLSRIPAQDSVAGIIRIPSSVKKDIREISSKTPGKHEKLIYDYASVIRMQKQIPEINRTIRKTLDYLVEEYKFAATDEEREYVDRFAHDFLRTCGFLDPRKHRRYYEKNKKA